MLQGLVKQRLYNIQRGFEVIDSVADDHDEYGPLYWITCRNGWTGRDHEINTKICKELRKELVNLVNEGARINGKIHYIDPKIIFSDKYMSEISKEEYDTNMKSKEFLTELKGKLKQGLSECSTQIFKSWGISISQTNIDELISVYNPEIFKISFWTMINTNRTNDDFKTTIENMLSKTSWRIKYAYKLIINTSNLTQKEKEILEFPYTD
jgi:hypothetical protein